MARSFFKNFDPTLLIVTLVLVGIGLVMVYSTTHADLQLSHGDSFTMVKRQLGAALLGAILFGLFLFFDYRLSDRMAQLFYLLNIICLALVLTPLGTETRGAQSWLLGFQPSEFAKVILVLTFGKYLAERDSLNSFYNFFGPMVYLGLPLLLIILQPDLGTALVFCFIFLIMLYLAGAPGRKVLLLVMAAVLAIVMVFVGCRLLNKPLPLKDYQIARLTSFLHPQRDPHGAGWNMQQAMIAVGSGQFSGKGLFRGTQGRLGYLPEKHTDFIYAVLGEELGFIGGFGVLFLFFCLLWRGIKIAYQARDKTGQLVAGGIVALFLFHVLENIGMNLGLMPITGIPLPFISYGGSALVANLAAVGILNSIRNSQYRSRF